MFPKAPHLPASGFRSHTSVSAVNGRGKEPHLAGMTLSLHNIIIRVTLSSMTRVHSSVYHHFPKLFDDFVGLLHKIIKFSLYVMHSLQIFLIDFKYNFSMLKCLREI